MQMSRGSDHGAPLRPRRKDQSEAGVRGARTVLKTTELRPTEQRCALEGAQAQE